MVRAPGRVTPWPRGVVGERGGGIVMTIVVTELIEYQ